MAEASGAAMVDELVPELMARGRELGGNYVFVQTIQTRFEITTRQQYQSYPCGTQQTPQTCSRIVTTTEEFPVTQMIARTYRVEGM